MIVIRSKSRLVNIPASASLSTSSRGSVKLFRPTAKVTPSSTVLPRNETSRAPVTIPVAATLVFDSHEPNETAPIALPTIGLDGTKSMSSWARSSASPSGSGLLPGVAAVWYSMSTTVPLLSDANVSVLPLIVKS